MEINKFYRVSNRKWSINEKRVDLIIKDLVIGIISKLTYVVNIKPTSWYINLSLTSSASSFHLKAIISMSTSWGKRTYHKIIINRHLTIRIRTKQLINKFTLDIWSLTIPPIL